MTEARVTQFHRQTLRDGEAPVRVAQIAREVLRDADAPVRVAQLDRQVLRDAAAPVHAGQLYRVVLRSRRDSPYPNFPVRLFCPPSLGVRIEGGALGGGASLSGDQALEALDAGGHWTMTFGETPLWDREKLLAWRSFTTGADMGAMPCIIPLWDRLYQPFAAPKYAGDTDFAERVWRDTPAWSGVEIQAAVTADAAQHAKVVAFSYAGGRALQGGEHFSIYGPRYGWRLYRLVRQVDDSPHAWEIRPPLREWVEAGTGLNFDSPRCTMRAEGDLSEVVELLRFGRGAATFVESFSRYP